MWRNVRAACRQLSSLTADGLESTTVANGVRLATQAFGGHVASVSVSVAAGSRYETAATSGICALVQKAALIDANDALRTMGGSATGSTNRETTTYTATVLKEHVPEAASILAKAVSKPPSGDAFEAAKMATLASFGVIPTDQAGLLEELHACAYLETQMGSPVSGTPASVSALTDGDAAAALASPAYSNIQVAAVGCSAADVSPAFADLTAASAVVESSALAPEKAPAIFTGSDKKISFDSLEFARICFAYEFPTLTDPRATAAKMLPFILAAPKQAETSLYEAYNSHAKLTRDLAEQEAIVSVEPFYMPYSDSALFGVSVVTKDVRVEDCMWYTCNNLVRLCYDVTESELDRAKLAFKATLAKTFASPSALSLAYVSDLSYLGRAVPPSELVARVQDLDLKTVKDTAYEFIHDCDHALAAVGPLHELPDYNWIRTASYNYHY